MLRIDKYYDVTCQNCSKSRSVDFELGMWMYDIPSFRKQLKKEGWKENNGYTLCPNCNEMKRR